jgi:predicted Zn-dependent protease
LIIQISLAELLLSNEPKISKTTLENLIPIFPDHLPLIITYAKALIMLNEPLKAKQRLNIFNQEHLEDLLEEPQIYELLMACNQQLQATDEVLFLQAKLMVINHQLDEAIQKIDLALAKTKKINENNKYNNNFYKINKFKTELLQYKENLKSIKF